VIRNPLLFPDIWVLAYEQRLAAVVARDFYFPHVSRCYWLAWRVICGRFLAAVTSWLLLWVSLSSCRIKLAITGIALAPL